MATIGPNRDVAATTTAKRNATVLPPGDYVATVQGSPCFFSQGASTIVAASTTSDRRRDGDSWEFTGALLRVRGHVAEASGHRPPGSQKANARVAVAARNALPDLLADRALLLSLVRE